MITKKGSAEIVTSSNFTFNYNVSTNFLCDNCSCKDVCKYIDNAKRINDKLEKINKDDKDECPVKATISCEYYTPSIYKYIPQETLSTIKINECHNGTEINPNENVSTSSPRKPLYVDA